MYFGPGAVQRSILYGSEARRIFSESPLVRSLAAQLLEQPVPRRAADFENFFLDFNLSLSQMPDELARYQRLLGRVIAEIGESPTVSKEDLVARHWWEYFGLPNTVARKLLPAPVGKALTSVGLPIGELETTLSIEGFESAMAKLEERARALAPLREEIEGRMKSGQSIEFGELLEYAVGREKIATAVLAIYSMTSQPKQLAELKGFARAELTFDIPEKLRVLIPRLAFSVKDGKDEADSAVFAQAQKRWRTHFKIAIRKIISE